MRYTIDTCPYSDTWFSNGGRCGWGHCCKSCEENENMIEELNKYREAFNAAKAFIDSHVADPDITNEMLRNYRIYLKALEALST